jgi:Zn-dependent protease
MAFQPNNYPPPPEYYLPRPQADTLPPPPPEHAQANGATQRATSGSGATVGGVLLSLGSALLSFALYTAYGSWQLGGDLFAGWEFGLGLVLLLLVHEMGHFVVIRAKGLPAALPVFIPFLGAYVAMRRMPHSVRDEAEIALAGPLAGALAGAVCFLLYQEASGLEAHTLLFLAYFSFLINLLNLAPIAPLDGGHIVGAISRWLWPIGLALIAVAFIYTLNLLLLLLGWLWFSQTIARFRMSRRQPYYDIRLPTRLYISALYFGLAAGLGAALYVAQGLLYGGGGFLGQ